MSSRTRAQPASRARPGVWVAMAGARSGASVAIPSVTASMTITPAPGLVDERAPILEPGGGLALGVGGAAEGGAPRKANISAGQPKPTTATAPAAAAVQIVPSSPPGPAISSTAHPTTAAERPRPPPKTPASTSTADCSPARAISADAAQASAITPTRVATLGKRAASRSEKETAPVLRSIGPR